LLLLYFVDEVFQINAYTMVLYDGKRTSNLKVGR